MGLGPFIYQFRTEKSIQLRYHPHYYSGRPFLDRVQIRFFDDQQQLVDALTNGQIDYAELEDAITAQRIHELMGRKILVFTVPRPEKKLYFLLFNLRQFPFSEPEVRQAIMLGINRKQIIKRFTNQNGHLAHTIFDEESPNYLGGSFSDSYNPTQALKLLLTHGWRVNPVSGIRQKDGRPLSFRLYFARNSSLEENIARTIKIYLSELNINVQPVPVPPLQKMKLIQKNQFEAIIGDFEYDPNYPFQAVEDFYLNILRGDIQKPNYQNRHIDRVLNLAYRNPQLRKQLLQRFQLYVRRDLPVIFLFFDHQIIVAVSSRFHNVRNIYRTEYNYYYRLNPFSNWFVPKSLQKYTF